MNRKFQVVANLICLFNKGVKLRKMKVQASKLLFDVMIFKFQTWHMEQNQDGSLSKNEEIMDMSDAHQAKS